MTTIDEIFEEELKEFLCQTNMEPLDENFNLMKELVLRRLFDNLLWSNYQNIKKALYESS